MKILTSSIFIYSVLSKCHASSNLFRHSNICLNIFFPKESLNTQKWYISEDESVLDDSRRSYEMHFFRTDIKDKDQITPAVFEDTERYYINLRLGKIKYFLLERIYFESDDRKYSLSKDNKDYMNRFVPK